MLENDANRLDPRGTPERGVPRRAPPAPSHPPRAHRRGRRARPAERRVTDVPANRSGRRRLGSLRASGQGPSRRANAASCPRAARRRPRRERSAKARREVPRRRSPLGALSIYRCTTIRSCGRRPGIPLRSLRSLHFTPDRYPPTLGPRRRSGWTPPGPTRTQFRRRRIAPTRCAHGGPALVPRAVPRRTAAVHSGAALATPRRRLAVTARARAPREESQAPARSAIASRAPSDAPSIEPVGVDNSALSAKGFDQGQRAHTPPVSSSQPAFARRPKLRRAPTPTSSRATPSGHLGPRSGSARRSTAVQRPTRCSAAARC